MRKRKTFTAEFKKQAVQRTLSEDRSIAEVARELGIKGNRLYQWRAEYLASTPPEVVPSAATAEQEVIRLRRELERVRQERDFLKKAAAFFAQNPE
jgi:transposase